MPPGGDWANTRQRLATTKILDTSAPLATFFAAREDGAVVVDLWENEDRFHRMRDDPEFRRNVEAAGWPSEPKVEISEVRATMQ
jgi:hypothetical protein